MSVKVFVILQAVRNFPDVTILTTHFGQDQGSQGGQGDQCGQPGQVGQGGQNDQGGQGGQDGRGGQDGKGSQQGSLKIKVAQQCSMTDVILYKTEF